MQTYGSIQGPNAEDYPPFYKRFLINPLDSHYFNWLPAHIFSSSDITILQLLERPRDFYRHLNEFIPKFRKPWHKPLELPYTIQNVFVEGKQNLMRKAIIALRLRAAFRRLVHVWIWRKARKTPAPDTDAITMAPFVQSVTITDMQQRRTYTFEAAALVKHIESQLNYVSYGFVQSMWPRNPITNLPFSTAQLFELYRQCVAYGRINAAFAAFAECKFNVERYIHIYGEAISFHYTMTTISQVDNEIGHEMLIESIQITAESLNMQLGADDLDVFTYGLTHFPAHPYFKKWRRIMIAQKFCNEDSIEDQLLVESISNRARELLEFRDIVLREFRRARLQVGDE